MVSKLKKWLIGLFTGLVVLGGSYLVTQDAFDKGLFFEGKRNHAYPDIVYGWDLPTICYGHTKGVKKGDYKTDEECLELFKLDLAQGCEIVAKAIGEDQFNALTQGEKDGYCLFAHNTGYFKLQRSGNTTSMYKRLIADDRKGACEALLMYDRANGKVLKGLTQRRKFEYDRCMSELNEL